MEGRTYDDAYSCRSNKLQADPRWRRAIWRERAEETKTNGGENPADDIHRAIHICHLYSNSADEGPGSNDEGSRQPINARADWGRSKADLKINWKIV